MSNKRFIRFHGCTRLKIGIIVALSLSAAGCGSSSTGNVSTDSTTPSETTASATTVSQTTPSETKPSETTPSNDATGLGEVSEIEELQRSEGVLAFPGALGYAKNATGGRAGRMVVVNTVSNVVDPNDGFISLREAIEEEAGARTIVFEVGGVFDTGITSLRLSGESGSNTTLACQTAPAPGVVIKTYGFNIIDGAHDVVFRHCAIRGIDVGAEASEGGRTVTIRGASRNIVLDHMSLSWATDEGFQAYLDESQTAGLENITISNSIVAEGDADSSHPESIEHASWGYHAMGPSCLNNNRSFRPTNCSIVNNFVAHNSARNVMIWGGAGEMSNNIVYNWFGIGLTAKPYYGNDADVIVNNNLMKSGPNTEGATDNPSCGPDKYRCAMALGSTDAQGVARYSVGNNYYLSGENSLLEPALIHNPYADTPAGEPQFDLATPSPIDIREMAAKDGKHMSCIGASRPQRDLIDERIIQEFYDGTGAIGIGENNRAGGHNVNVQRMWNVYAQPSAHPAGYDVDQDGMPDEWELRYGLNPLDPTDHAGDLDGDGYTNIEEYLAIAALC